MTPFSSRQKLARPLLAVGVLVAFAALRAVTGDVPATWFLVAAALVVAAQVAAWLLRTLELQPGGLLVVSGPVPGRRRVLDLTALLAVSAGQRVSHAERGGLRIRDVLDLADAAGNRLTLSPREWALGDLLVAAVEQAAPVRDVPIAGGELFDLAAPADPLPARPAPTGPQPTLDVRARLRGLWLFLGVVFALVGGGVGLMFGVAALLLSLVSEGLSEPGFVPVLLLSVLVGVAFLLGGLFVCWSALAARLRVAADGLLTVRSVPPWRTRSIALGELAAVEARHAGYLSVNRGAPRPRVALRLRDRGGRELKLDAGSWTRPDLVAAAVAHGAAASGVGLDPATDRYLTAGTAPSPTGVRP